MYNLKQTFITVGHEVAHFVGTDVRSRDERTKHMVNICGRIIALSMKSYLSHMDEKNSVLQNMDESDFDGLELKLCEWIGFYIDREQDGMYLREHKYHESITDETVKVNLKNKRIYHEHLDVLRVRIVSAVKEMLLIHGEDIFGYIFYQEFYKNENEIGYEGREDFLAGKMKMLRECIYHFVNRPNSKNQVLTMSGAIDNVIYLIQECYADMICVLTLKLTLRDYLEAITEIIDESDFSFDKLTDTNLIARVAIVMSVIGHSLENDPQPKGQEALFRWTDDEFDYRVDEEKSVGKLENAANIFVCNYIQGAITILPDDIINNAVGIIYDRKILIEIITYLLKCRKKYYKKLIDSKADSIQYVQDIYSLSRQQDSGDFFGKLMNMIAHYETDVYAEIQKVVSTEK